MHQEEHGQNYLKQNLNYLLVLRSIAIGTQILALVFMYYAFSAPIPLVSVFIVISILAIYTIYSWQKLQKKSLIVDVDYMTQLVVDILALSMLVYFTGGSTNPFIFFFLLPITFAAASLRLKQTCVIAGISALSYTMLMFFHVPLLKHTGQHEGFDLHVWGMWYGFLISAGLVTYFVSRIGATVRKRNQALAMAREESLRADQVLALGTLAAGTAHELGTPLSTMAVLAKELEHEHQSEPDILDNLQLLRQQIDRCKTILSKMVVDAGTAHAESGEAKLLNEYLLLLLDNWKSLRPDIKLVVSFSNTDPTLEIIADATLSQSIMNVLNNAADAANQQVEFIADWDHGQLHIEILDDGDGIESSFVDNIAKPVDSQKQPVGMGIGLFLAQITLNRLGGKLEISIRKHKGTCVKISLPLTGLRTT